MKRTKTKRYKKGGRMLHFPVLVITKPQENLNKVMNPFSNNLEINPSIIMTKDDIIKEAKARKKWLKDSLSDDPETVLSEFDKNVLKSSTDEELYQAYREDDFYDYDEAGNRISFSNPDGKWERWQIGGNFANKLRTTDGRTLSQCTVGELDTSDNDEIYYESLKWWYDNIEGHNTELANQHREQYNTSNVYAYIKSKLHFENVLKDNLWYEMECSEKEWANTFQAKFLSLCKDEDIVTLIDCMY